MRPRYIISLSTPFSAFFAFPIVGVQEYSTPLTQSVQSIDFRLCISEELLREEKDVNNVFVEEYSAKKFPDSATDT